MSPSLSTMKAVTPHLHVAVVQGTRAQGGRADRAQQAGDRCQVPGPPGPHGHHLSRQNQPPVGSRWRCLQVQGQLPALPQALLQEVT